MFSNDNLFFLGKFIFLEELQAAILKDEEMKKIRIQSGPISEHRLVFQVKNGEVIAQFKNAKQAAEIVSCKLPVLEGYCSVKGKLMAALNGIMPEMTLSRLFKQF